MLVLLIFASGLVLAVNGGRPGCCFPQKLAVTQKFAVDLMLTRNGLRGDTFKVAGDARYVFNNNNHIINLFLYSALHNKQNLNALYKKYIMINNQN